MKNILIVSLLLLTAPVLAQKSDDSAKDTSDKLDIKKLEQKYWSAKDDDYSVVQNRAFTKEKRYFVYGAYGIPINDPYNAGQVYTTNIGYYFTEKWGAEVSYMSYFLGDNDSTDQFSREHKTVPNHNRLKNSVTLRGTFVPLYAKMSFLDKKIIYFDMGIGLGVGQTNYEIVNDDGNKQEVGTHWDLNVFQHYFFSEYFALRMDFRNMWTVEEKEKYRTQANSTERKLGTGTVNDTALSFGLTFWY